MRSAHTLVREQYLPRPVPEVFDFFANASNLEAITPSFLAFRIRTPLPIAMQTGARIEYKLSLFGVPAYWRTVISVWEPNRRFVDEQESGPFELWRHEHLFEEREGGTWMRDRVEYIEPLGALGWVAHHAFVRHLLSAVFDFRAKTIASSLPAP